MHGRCLMYAYFIPEHDVKSLIATTQYKSIWLQYTDSYCLPTRHRKSKSTSWYFASGVCCHSNETRAPIPNLPYSAQLEDTSYHSPSYIHVCAVVWACGEGQTDTQTCVTNVQFEKCKMY